MIFCGNPHLNGKISGRDAGGMEENCANDHKYLCPEAKALYSREMISLCIPHLFFLLDVYIKCTIISGKERLR